MTAAFSRMRFEDSAIAEHVEFAWSVALRPQPVDKPLYIPADGRVEVQRIERFQRFMALIRAPAHQQAGISRIAADLGYSDESHLVRDARELVGASPGALAAAGQA